MILKIAALLFLVSHVALSQGSILGKWKSIDDATGEQKSIVEIFERDGKIFGRIARIFPHPGEDPDPVCDQCAGDDPRYRKKIIGLEIIQEMVAAGNEFTSGNILDPENGKVYKCKLWLEGAALKVRGYWGVFYRTQTWTKAD